MFFRPRKSGNHVYLQVVENHWEDGRSEQRVVANHGRLDQLQASGQLEGMLLSGAKNDWRVHTRTLLLLPPPYAVFRSQ
jgi:hypothetical protein